MDGIYRTRESGDSERTGLSSQGLREGGRDLRIGRGASRRGQGLKERDRDSEKGDISGIGMGTQRGDWGLETGVIKLARTTDAPIGGASCRRPGS